MDGYREELQLTREVAFPLEGGTFGAIFDPVGEPFRAHGAYRSSPPVRVPGS